MSGAHSLRGEEAACAVGEELGRLPRLVEPSPGTTPRPGELWALHPQLIPVAVTTWGPRPWEGGSQSSGPPAPKHSTRAHGVRPQGALTPLPLGPDSVPGSGRGLRSPSGASAPLTCNVGCAGLPALTLLSRGVPQSPQGRARGGVLSIRLLGTHGASADASKTGWDSRRR